ncbi:MAG: NAD-dependent epimerase/dehydratase family protein [Chlamydiota bacterium]|nr:NAD-dependent epimerase/dehydratase family protein [Chlamydiota bacterium]
MIDRILVTGAAGFIGFHLLKELKKRDNQLLGVDNFNSYYDQQLKRDRAKEVDVAILEGDLSDYTFLKNLVAQFKPTHIVNLAAQAGVRYSIEEPREYLKSNVDGFFNILEVCRENPDIKLIYASSSSVYGENEKTPFLETDRTDLQASFYGVTKKTNELMARVYHEIYGISVTGLRFFTVYGPWGRPDMAYFSFTKKILAGETIKVFNNGAMLRDFTYIDDIIQGIIAAVDLGAKHEIFNLGNNTPVPLGRFIEILEDTIGKKAVKENLPMQAGDVTKTYADIEKSKEMLGYEPRTPLEKGIPKFFEWYQAYFARDLLLNLD